jgi:putative transposase
MGPIHMIFVFLGALFRRQAELAAENLALRQQLAVLEHKAKRPRLRKRDRIFWVWLSRLWADWRSVLVIVQPGTVVRWHRDGFRLYWRWKSRTGKAGRPKIDAEIRKLIRSMCRENHSWGAPRIHSELELLGYDVSETTVAKYMVRHRKPPSQTWRTFLDNHVRDIAAVDFFTVPTATFRILFAFVVLRHERRKIVHFNVTANPTAAWTAQQVIEAFPEDLAPRFVIRDRDSIYGAFFCQRIKNMGIEEVVTAARSPWQNPYAERVIGSIRCECLRHVIVLNERHLKRILQSYLEYYHEDRTHLSLERNSPTRREVEQSERGKVVSLPRVGGLHHRYRRAA